MGLAETVLGRRADGHATPGVAATPRADEDKAPAERGATFEAIYEAHRDALYGYVRRLLPNPADAEDLTVDAFEKALRAWERRPPDAEIRPWLFRIATNACLDELRRRQRIRWLPLETFLTLFLTSPRAPDDPERDVLRRDDAARVRAALDRLAPRDRAALILRESYDLPVEEVARVIGSKPSTAKVVLFRARERFRVIYRQLDGEYPGSPVEAPSNSSPKEETQ